MYATVHQFRRSMAGEAPGWADALADRLFADVPSGFCVLAEFGGRDGAAVSYWSTREAAERAADHRIGAGAVGLDVAVYEVIERNAGVASEERPAVAQLMAFDGPRSAIQSAASERAGRERLWPAVRDVPGLVGVHVLRDEDNGLLVMSMATSLEVLEAGQKAIGGTELLPDEDPALLSDPDRVQLHRVLAARLPETATTGERA
jgi:hypothetical protein